MDRRRKILILAALVLCAAALIPIVRHYQLAGAVQRYRDELKSQGEPWDLAQVIPPPVPPSLNGAALFLPAAGRLATNDSLLADNPPLAMRGVAPGKAMVGWAQNEIRGEAETNSWADIQNALQTDRAGIQLLARITNAPPFDFNLQYAQHFDMRLTHLSLEKKAAQRLAADAQNDLHGGGAESAARDLHVILALVNGTGDERLAISQLVRIAIAQIGFGVTWEFLQSSNLTDVQLAALQSDLSRLEFIRAARKVLPVERVGGEANLEQSRASNAELRHYFSLQKQAHELMGVATDEDSVVAKILMPAKIFLWRHWWSYADELRYLKGTQVLIDTLQQAEAKGAFAGPMAAQDRELDQLGILHLGNSLDTLLSGKTDFHSMISESVNTLAGLARKVLKVETARQVTITAVALKRYHLQHGSYPGKLSELVPEFVSAVPCDPVDGQPLRYRRNGDGTFTLYSIGRNNQDDGGDSSLEPGTKPMNFQWQDDHALDWVWPQPATDAEIQKYFAGQAAG